MTGALLSARGLLVLLGVVVVAGLFHRSIRQLPTEAYVCLRDALQAAITAVGGARDRLVAAARQEAGSVGLGGDKWSAAYVVGALVSSAFFMAFLTCEWQVVAESLEGLGIDSAVPAFPLGLGLLMGLSLVLPLVFAVWMLKELCGQAYLVPVAHFGRWERVAFGTCAGLVIVLSVAVIAALGLFRAEVLMGAGEATSAGASPAASQAETALDLLDAGAVQAGAAGAWETRATRVTMVALPLSLALSALLAWETGVTVTLKLLPAALIGVSSVPVWLGGLGLRFLLTVLNGVFAVAVIALQWVQRVGIAFSRPMVNGFRWLSEWGGRGNSGGRVVASLASSWVWDVETPRGAIGEERSLDGVPPNGGDSGDTPAPDEAAPDDRAGIGAVAAPPAAASPAAREGAALEIPIDLAWSAEPERPSRAWNPFPPRRTEPS